MLSSITPLGQRGRGMSWARTVVFFWIGAILAGAAVFGGAAAVGEASGLVNAAPVIGLFGLAIALLLDLFRVKPLGLQRQVDENWLGSYRDWVVGFGFGAQLGSGFATIVPTWGTWALLVVSTMVGLPSALVVGASFGLGRSVLLVATRSSTSPGSLADSMRNFASAESRARWLSLVGYGSMVVAGGFYVA